MYDYVTYFYAQYKFAAFKLYHRPSVHHQTTDGVGSSQTIFWLFLAAVLMVITINIVAMVKIKGIKHPYAVYLSL